MHYMDSCPKFTRTTYQTGPDKGFPFGFPCATPYFMLALSPRTS